MAIYWLCLIPFLLWVTALFLANDRLNSVKIAVSFDLVTVACFVAGLVLYKYQVFPVKRGFFIVVFAVPLIHVVDFELLRLIYRSIRHENPCYNVRSGRNIGDPPVNGFFTKCPPEKVLSWADILFGVSQMLIFLVVVMTLFIASLAMDW